MGRGLRPAMALLTKWLLTDLRVPSCQHMYRGTAAAVPGSTTDMSCKGRTLHDGPASKSSAYVYASPLVVKVQGNDAMILRQLRNITWLPLYAEGKACQQQRMSPCSTQQQHTQQEGLDISLLEPALQKQWDHAKHAHMGNIVIKPHSNKEVWWTCDQCPDGHPHSWSATVYNRTRGTGCPQCTGRKVCKHNSLATKAPGVAAQWDYEENDGTPDSVVAQSSQVVSWLCDACGHKWSATPDSRVSKRKSGCPDCATVARRTKKQTKHPTFAECQDPEVRALLGEWDHIRNAAKNSFPHNTRLRSAKQINWLCTKCPAGQEHSWSAQPCDRTSHNKTGCPSCAGRAACKCNSLQALYPDVAAEWDYSKNKGQPSEYPASSGYLAWWSSPQRGSWQQTISSRTSVVHQRIARFRRVQQRRASSVSSRTDY